MPLSRTFSNSSRKQAQLIIYNYISNKINIKKITSAANNISYKYTFLPMNSQYQNGEKKGRNPHAQIANWLNCDIVVTEFELCYVQFKLNTLRKCRKILSLELKSSYVFFSTKKTLVVNNKQLVICY